MPKRKPIWDVLSKEKKRKCIKEIIAFFLDERGEEIGIVAAEQVFDAVMGSTFADVYNKGVVDAQKIVEEKQADMNIDLDLLLKDK